MARTVYICVRWWILEVSSEGDEAVSGVRGVNRQTFWARGDGVFHHQLVTFACRFRRLQILSQTAAVQAQHSSSSRYPQRCQAHIWDRAQIRQNWRASAAAGVRLHWWCLRLRYWHDERCDLPSPLCKFYFSLSLFGHNDKFIGSDKKTGYPNFELIGQF